jgi:hypothetical protein
MHLFTSSIIVATVALASANAHAMGRYVNLDLVAWNTDGTAAIVERSETSSGQAGTGHDYLLVVAGEQSPKVFTFTNTLDADTATEHVDAATCVRTAKDLERAIKSKHFSGVTVKSDACKLAARPVVGFSSTTTTAVAKSWIANLDRPATPREVAALAAMRAAVGPDDEGEVATLTGKLVIVLWGINGDSSARAHGAGITPTGKAFVVGDDLR